MALAPGEARVFRFPGYLRYLLRGSLPAIAAGLFLFSLSHGWTSDQALFGVFCLAAGLAWWWGFRRYGLTVTLQEDAIRFTRAGKSTSVPWAEITSVQFSTSGVRIRGKGSTWRVDSHLSGWEQFERLLRDHTSAQALAGWLIPPFTIRTKWRGFSSWHYLRGVPHRRHKSYSGWRMAGGARDIWRSSALSSSATSVRRRTEDLAGRGRLVDSAIGPP